MTVQVAQVNIVVLANQTPATIKAQTAQVAVVVLVENKPPAATVNPNMLALDQ